MIPPPPNPPPSDVLAPEPAEVRMRLAWRVAPFSLAFFLDLVDLGRHRDVLDSLIFGAILTANTATLNQDPHLAQSYADIHEAVPDEIRRPLSINALAQSLRLPFETTRRRVGRMMKTGDVIMTPRGVYVPSAAITNAPFLTMIQERHERLRLFYLDLQALGALPPPPRPATPATPDAAPLRLTNRAVAEYMLRIADPMIALAGDPAAALILMQLTHSNIAGLGPEELADWVANPAGAGRPIRPARLAQHLRFSTETTRRQAIALEAGGFCIRSRDGLAATAPPEAHGAIAQMAEDNLANAQRLFARLRQLGALAAWDKAPAAAGRASRR